MSAVILSEIELDWCKEKAVKDWFYQKSLLSTTQQEVNFYDQLSAAVVNHSTAETFFKGRNMGWGRNFPSIGYFGCVKLMKRSYNQYREAMRFAIESRKSKEQP